MKLNKSQGDLLKRVIERWEADGTIDVSTADRLKGSYTVRSFEWKELAKFVSFFLFFGQRRVCRGSSLGVLLGLATTETDALQGFQ